MLKACLGVARINFLTLALVCIALAAAMAWYLNQSLPMWETVAVTLLALAAHISVNAFNEYFDFRSGLDALTTRTPFSGGSGTLQAHPQFAYAALGLAIATLLLSIMLGLSLAYVHHWQLLWIGFPGVVIIYSYTQYLNRFPLLCLLAPGVGFGLFLTLGASWVLSEQLTAGMWIIALMVTLLASNLLLLNQFPDVEADQQVGRRHYPIVLGRRLSAMLFVGLLMMLYVLLGLGIAMHWLPLETSLGFVTLLLAFPLSQQVLTHANNIEQLHKALGMNVALCHVLPLCLAIGLYWAS